MRTAAHTEGTLTTIDVADVEPASTPLPEVPYKVAVESLLTPPRSPWHGKSTDSTARPVSPVEACSRYHGQLVADVSFHPFLAAVHLAFNDHRPLVLSPDMLWLLVAQGFANHVNANAEDLRPFLVDHEGRITIEVRRDDFVKGSPDNPWPEVFTEFSTLIRDHIGEETHDLLTPSFSTTGVAERAAAEIVLLDAMRSFFDYELHTICGIPQVILEGTTEDWTTLAERTRGMAKFGLGWWTRALAPILDEFVAASRGQVDTGFWQSIYKLEGGSGGPFTNGWITAFFPYLKNRQTGRALGQNPWLARGGDELQALLYPPKQGSPKVRGNGPTTASFPSGLARAPFVWRYLTSTFEMDFLGGFVGVRQEPDSLRLRPEIGWAVRERVVDGRYAAMDDWD